MGSATTLRSIILLLSIFFAHIIYAQGVYAHECVVLLHGYLRSAKCMQPIAKILEDKGYKVQNLSYSSTDYSIQTISREHVAPKIEHTDCEKIHFIGHSMGGIVIRYYLSENKLPNLGNVIFITVPNRGSELVSSIENNRSFTWTLIGPAVRELSPTSPILLNMPEPHYRAGIITASKSVNPVTSLFLLEGPNDGTLTIESMKLKNMADLIDFNATHTTVLTHLEIGDKIASFLKYGRFIK